MFDVHGQNYGSVCMLKMYLKIKQIKHHQTTSENVNITLKAAP